MKFVKQLSAVISLVAIVVGLGFALKHSPLASTISGGHEERERPTVILGSRSQPSESTGEIRGAGDERRPVKSGPITKAGIKDIGQTGVTLLAIMGGVVFIDSRRRDPRRQALRSLRTTRT